MNPINPEILTRINKYLSGSGLFARKQADELVKQGVVMINGQLAKLGDQVAEGDVVTVDGEVIEPLADDKVVCIALNKPIGVVCTAASSVKNNIIDHVGYSERVFPVGRLDKDSQGLILLTNKSGLAEFILNSEHEHEKEYLVTVDKSITSEFIQSMSQGVPVLDQVTKPCTVLQESDRVFSITLTQGLNRQIRRMCQYHGFKVEKLERVRIMHVHLNDLPLGHWRELTVSEISVMLNASLML
ncbi:23S rRNA pseudouridine(2604) synthase RluF [Marinicella rhabdoformis]|uniref:23S rRNA pseudouridine(2604) synthase RluF n=1 Tax=Marinicella rhabdoformis TaxID=2580566 RepID=UPI0015D01A9E|nr:23S rRNA pseudouridine(2604) synthase RluF [Marinicella rhabdoformis]